MDNSITRTNIDFIENLIKNKDIVTLQTISNCWKEFFNNCSFITFAIKTIDEKEDCSILEWLLCNTLYKITEHDFLTAILFNKTNVLDFIWNSTTTRIDNDMYKNDIALEFAISGNNFNSVKWLFSKKAKCTPRNICCALRKGYLHIVSYIIENIDESTFYAIGKYNNYNISCLTYRAFKYAILYSENKFETVHYLINNTKFKFNSKVIELAIDNGLNTIARYLLILIPTSSSNIEVPLNTEYQAHANYLCYLK